LCEQYRNRNIKLFIQKKIQKNRLNIIKKVIFYLYIMANTEIHNALSIFCVPVTINLNINFGENLFNMGTRHFFRKTIL